MSHSSRCGNRLAIPLTLKVAILRVVLAMDCQLVARSMKSQHGGGHMKAMPKRGEAAAQACAGAHASPHSPDRDRQAIKPGMREGASLAFTGLLPRLEDRRLAMRSHTQPYDAPARTTQRTAFHRGETGYVHHEQAAA
ncbi:MULTISPECIES: hypothetical protein [Xanthomonas]|uniref:hypothetical protein n=1 Tax=Xanthomonas TaxID=338 RepID=UPI0013A5EB60|nr:MULTISPECIES: hypothetical protein [Xanthomonas]